MADANKIAALKTATHGLLTQLKNAATNPEDVYVSMVPFVKDVNVGPSNYGASWIRWDLWEEVNGHCSNNTYKNKTNCLSHGKVWTPNNHNTWNGCVTDRDQNYDTLNTAPGTGSTLYPAEQYASCPATPVKGLTNNWDSLNAAVDTMQASSADSPRHPASLTKIMTLYLLFERLEQGKIKLTTDLPVSARAALQAPSKLGLKPGETIRVETAIRAIVTKSANDVAVIVAEALGGDEQSFANLMPPLWFQFSKYSRALVKLIST